MSSTAADTASILGSTEVATILGIDKSTLTRMVAAGEITAERLGNRRNSALIFHADEVERVRRERASC